MTIANTQRFILASALVLILCASPACAQVTGSQVQSFSASVQNLTNWLAQTAGNDPNQKAWSTTCNRHSPS